MNRLHAAILAGLCLGVSARGVDLNTNQMSDVWEAYYGVTNQAAATDWDGDGVPNQVESVAGTDPYNPLSFPAIALTTPTGGVKAAWNSWAGKIYTLEAADAPDQPWTVITNIPGTNAQQLAAIDLANFTQRLFRVRINDLFSDGSGLSDWEKLQAGLSLTNTFSNGHYDPQGRPISDYAYVTSQLAQQSVLSIVASDLTTVQPDPGTPAQDPGSFTILRGGFPFRSFTGTVALAGTAVEGSDYTNLPRSLAFPAGVLSQTIVVTPLANTNRIAPATCTMNLQPGAGYALGGPASASVLIYPSPAPKGSGLTGEYWDNTNATSYSSAPNLTTGSLVATRTDPTIDFTWGATNLPPNMTTAVTFQVRWSGQVQPQYSEAYYFNINSDNGARLWIDNQLVIDGWSAAGDRTSLPIPLVAGVRYDIRVEYWQSSSSTYIKLSWYSDSQPKQIIPTSRLYPTNVPPAPPAMVSVVAATAILGYPFTNVVAVNNGAGIVSVGPMPPGLVFAATNRLISGVPTQAGRFQIAIAATNAAGSANSILDLTVIDTGAVISREVWTNVPGTAIAAIPVDTAASVTGQLATLEGVTDFGDNYGERWRGYLTAPLSGNYYFWIAGSDAAELWIGNDGEQVTRVKRCWVTPTNNPSAPPALGTGLRDWSAQPSQKSAWLVLEAGRRYYLEVLHKAGTGTFDNVAVGWVRPDQTDALPAGVVPGQVLSPYVPAIANSTSGTLFTATMLAQGAVISYGFGTATLRLNADETHATLRFSYTNLTSAVTGIHVHAETYQTNLNQMLFSVSEASPQADGSLDWPIQAAGTLSAADVREVLKQGKAFLDLHTTNYPLGEIRGNFTLAVGASAFIPPPAPPAWSDDHTTSNGAVRFLNQATFGASPSDIAAVRAAGYEAWIDSQFAQGPTYLLPWVLANRSSDPNNFYTGTLTFNSWWEKAVTAPDQLRQRVAFALSEILVISDVGTLNGNARVQTDYYDVLLDQAFGNFRELLEQVTLSPGMGLYLDMRGNAAGSIISGTHPNENYAREILQLFSVGLYRLWPDGTLVMNSKGDLVPTYDQKEILGYAAVFTGWNYYQSTQANGRLPTSFSPASNYTNAMVQVPSRHERGAKRVLDNTVLPAATGLQTNSANVEYDTYALNDLELALDAIFRNENCGPYICRQLIQRLVTSHPSRDYVYRVVQKFNDNGAGMRGDLKAVLKAILLDREARDPAMLNVATFGKQREPVLRVTSLARAFPSPSPLTGTYAQTGTATIAITFPVAHRFATVDRAQFVFETGTPLPTIGRYDVAVTATNRLTVTDAGLMSCTYVQSNGAMTVTKTDHYLGVSNVAYLTVMTGGASSGVYQVQTAINNSFTALTSDTNSRSGQLLIPRINGGFTVSGFAPGSTTNIIRFYTAQHHQLDTGTPVQAVFYSGIATDGVYYVSSNVDLRTFMVRTAAQSNDSNSSVYLYPLVEPPLNRSGTVTMQYNTFRMDNTDGALTQTPLNSPTVFNFFFPDYKFAGALAAAGLTTPEFQLTSDSGVANVNNFLAGAIINSQSTNTAGFSSFKDGGEALTLDLGPWCTSNNASSNGIPGLVESFNSLLLAGQLSTGVKTSIVAYVAPTNNLSFTVSNPTAAQIRDRVRAVLHLIVTSPSHAIQK